MKVRIKKAYAVYIDGVEVGPMYSREPIGKGSKAVYFPFSRIKNLFDSEQEANKYRSKMWVWIFACRKVDYKKWKKKSSK